MDKLLLCRWPRSILTESSRVTLIFKILEFQKAGSTISRYISIDHKTGFRFPLSQKVPIFFPNLLLKSANTDELLCDKKTETRVSMISYVFVT